METVRVTRSMARNSKRNTRRRRAASSKSSMTSKAKDNKNSDEIKVSKSHKTSMKHPCDSLKDDETLNLTNKTQPQTDACGTRKSGSTCSENNSLQHFKIDEVGKSRNCAAESKIAGKQQKKVKKSGRTTKKEKVNKPVDSENAEEQRKPYGIKNKVSEEINIIKKSDNARETPNLYVSVPKMKYTVNKLIDLENAEDSRINSLNENATEHRKPSELKNEIKLLDICDEIKDKDKVSEQINVVKNSGNTRETDVSPLLSSEATNNLTESSNDNQLRELPYTSDTSVNETDINSDVFETAEKETKNVTPLKLMMSETEKVMIDEESDASVDIVIITDEKDITESNKQQKINVSPNQSSFNTVHSDVNMATNVAVIDLTDTVDIDDDEVGNEKDRQNDSYCEVIGEIKPDSHTTITTADNFSNFARLAPMSKFKNRQKKLQADFALSLNQNDINLNIDITKNKQNDHSSQSDDEILVLDVEENFENDANKSLENEKVDFCKNFSSKEAEECCVIKKPDSRDILGMENHKGTSRENCIPSDTHNQNEDVLCTDAKDKTLEEKNFFKSSNDSPLSKANVDIEDIDIFSLIIAEKKKLKKEKKICEISLEASSNNKSDKIEKEVVLGNLIDLATNLNITENECSDIVNEFNKMELKENSSIPKNEFDEDGKISTMKIMSNDSIDSSVTETPAVSKGTNAEILSRGCNFSEFNTKKNSTKNRKRDYFLLHATGKDVLKPDNEDLIDSNEKNENLGESPEVFVSNITDFEKFTLESSSKECVGTTTTSNNNKNIFYSVNSSIVQFFNEIEISTTNENEIMTIENRFKNGVKCSTDVSRCRGSRNYRDSQMIDMKSSQVHVLNRICEDVQQEMKTKSLKENEVDWSNVNVEVLFLYSLIGCKPVGVNRHFMMVLIHNRFTNHLNHQLSSKVLWDKLDTMYDMSALHESEIIPFPDEEVDFELPEDCFELLESKFDVTMKKSNEDESNKNSTNTAKVPKKLTPKPKQSGTPVPAPKNNFASPVLNKPLKSQTAVKSETKTPANDTVSKIKPDVTLSGKTTKVKRSSSPFSTKLVKSEPVPVTKEDSPDTSSSKKSSKSERGSSPAVLKKPLKTEHNSTGSSSKKLSKSESVTNISKAVKSETTDSSSSKKIKSDKDQATKKGKSTSSAEASTKKGKVDANGVKRKRSESESENTSSKKMRESSEKQVKSDVKSSSHTSKRQERETPPPTGSRKSSPVVKVKSNESSKKVKPKAEESSKKSASTSKRRR